MDTRPIRGSFVRASLQDEWDIVCDEPKGTEGNEKTGLLEGFTFRRGILAEALARGRSVARARRSRHRSFQAQISRSRPDWVTARAREACRLGLELDQLDALGLGCARMALGI